MSRYGWISFSLMNCQMMRVISSPSSSTTVPWTLILAMCRDSPLASSVRARSSASPAQTVHAYGLPRSRESRDRRDDLPRHERLLAAAHVQGVDREHDAQRQVTGGAHAVVVTGP